MTNLTSGKLIARIAVAAAATMVTVCRADNPVVQTSY